MTQAVIESRSGTSSTSPAAAGRLPDFVIIGGMKCGSTTLFEYLCRHPDVFMCTPKEPGYFSRDHVMARGEAWYRSLFAGAKKNQIVGEASTCYTRWPHFGDVASRLHAAIPDARLVYIMRHPVERAYSHYAHVFQEHHLLGKPFDLTFEQTLESSNECIDSSMYLMQIEQYLRFFPREKMHFVTLDDLTDDPSQVLNGLQSFLELTPKDLLADGPLVANKGDGTKFARVRLMQKLKKLRQAPGVKQMLDVVPSRFRLDARSFLIDTIAQGFVGKRMASKHKSKQHAMKPETRPKLLDIFKQPTRDLENFLGRKLPEKWFK